VKEDIMTDVTLTVREIALEQPHSIRVFERFGIDYCCGGRKPLAEACAERQVAVVEVLAALEAAAGSNALLPVDWSQAKLGALIDHIVATHHAYVKSELPRLAVLAQKVVNRHGDTQAHLPAMQSLLVLLDDELIHHLGKEEHVLFPYIGKLEGARIAGGAHPEACFGTIESPIAMMMSEHDAAGAMVAELRRLSGDYATPVGACPTYLAYYDGLKEFEQDLHQHIHLENNILFPRAIAMEKAGVGDRCVSA
jgi:regulator of cell morphogenesis and NO signaling